MRVCVQVFGCQGQPVRSTCWPRLVDNAPSTTPFFAATLPTLSSKPEKKKRDFFFLFGEVDKDQGPCCPRTRLGRLWCQRPGFVDSPPLYPRALARIGNFNHPINTEQKRHWRTNTPHQPQHNSHLPIADHPILRSSFPCRPRVRKQIRHRRTLIGKLLPPWQATSSRGTLPGLNNRRN